MLEISKNLVNNRAIYFALSTLFFLIISSGVFKLSENTSYKVFFDAEDPMVSKYDSLIERFSQVDNFVVVVELKNGNIFDKKYR